MTQLELPYMMNVLLYINDILSIQNFMLVSKKSPLCALSLKINPYIPYKMYQEFYSNRINKYMPKKAEKFVDRLFLLFPNLQTLHLHFTNVKYLTDNHINKIDRILLSNDRDKSYLTSKKQYCDQKYYAKVVNYEGDPCDIKFDRLEHIHILPKYLQKKQLDYFPKAFITITYNSYVFGLMDVPLLPNNPINFSNDINDTPKELYNQLYVPFKLSVNRNVYNKNFSNDFRCFNHLTYLYYSNDMNGNKLFLPTTLKELDLSSNVIFPNIVEFKTSKVTKFTVGVFSSTKVPLPMNLKELVIEKKLTTNLKCPATLESLNVECELNYKKIIFNDKLKNLKLNTISYEMNLPKSLTSITVTKVDDKIMANGLKNLTIETQDVIKDYNIPTNLSSLTLTGTFKFNLKKLTNIKELYFAAITNNKGQIEFENFILPSKGLKKLTIYIKESVKLKIKPKDLINEISEIYSDNNLEITVDGNFIDEIRGY
ncbi:Leucine-rich repeat containing protein [Entamoeba marina]